MSLASVSTTPGRHRLEWRDSVLELVAERAGWRTKVQLFRDGELVGEAASAVRVLLPLEPEGPTVLALAGLPGVVSKAFLLVPKPSADETDDATGEEAGDPTGKLDDAMAELPAPIAKLAGFARAERIPFAPPPGTFAARLLEFQEAHPKLYASRHVLLASSKVLLGVLGVAVFLQFIVRHIVEWLLSFLPDIELPPIPWPDLDLPRIPWPDIELPDITLPPWLAVVLATAKYWIPILVAAGIAINEVRRRSKRADPEQAEDEHDDAHR